MDLSDWSTEGTGTTAYNWSAMPSQAPSLSINPDSSTFAVLNPISSPDNILLDMVVYLNSSSSKPRIILAESPSYNLGLILIFF